ncbi:hypothetical protein BC943DRAFT_326018 [Umbelopsis sp. AD052]|nr:hypothetical protein BC943DRAFT_326018 [Umbelopsis sp. AD052]
MMHRSWLTLLLLAVLATTCSGLSVTWPPPGYTVIIARTLQIQWIRSSTISPSVPGYVTFSLGIGGPQVNEMITLVTGVPDISGSTVVSIPYSVQAGTYYIVANDTNLEESVDVAGPYNLQLAVANAPTSSTPSLSASPASSTSSKTTPNSGWSFGLPLFMVPIIIILILLHVGCLVYAIRRRGWLAVYSNTCCGKLSRRKKTVVYETHYVVYSTEVEGSQTRIIGRPPGPIPSMYETPYTPEYPSRYSTYTVAHAQPYEESYSSEHTSAYPLHTVVYPPAHMSEQPPVYQQSKYY